MRVKNNTMRIKAAGPDDGLTEGQFQAYASVFGNKDSYGDVIRKGAFANTLKEWQDSGAPIPLLFGHNMSDPDYNIGAITEAKEDDHGLLVTAELDLDAAKAAQVYRLLKGRRLNQMSFAYDVVDGGETTDEEHGDFYELRELKVYEVSVVPIGANQETEVLAVKAAIEGLTAEKAGRGLSEKYATALREARAALDSVIGLADAVKTQEQEASAERPAKDEEPAGAKSEEPGTDASVDDLLAVELQLAERNDSHESS